MKSVSLFMDVEDPINPLADDAARDFPLIFSDAGVRGSFCVTGEKCRTLFSRGRTDVSDAYKPHCLGLHTNRHSFHPTTMELLADLEFDEGCVAAYNEERQGFESFQRLFGRAPSFWGGGGNTWSPEITHAMKRLGIPSYVYALTELPGHAVHRFNGVLACPQALGISETSWADDGRCQESVARAFEAIDQIDQPWVGLFVGHPTKFRYRDWWDVPYYHGRTPPAPEFTDPLPIETYERAKANLAAFLEVAKCRFNIVGLDDVIEMPWKYRKPTSDEMSYFVEHTSSTLMGAAGWPPHYKGLDPSLIVEKTMALKGTVEVAFI